MIKEPHAEETVTGIQVTWLSVSKRIKVAAGRGPAGTSGAPAQRDGDHRERLPRDKCPETESCVPTNTKRDRTEREPEISAVSGGIKQTAMWSKMGQKSSLTILVKELNDIQSAASRPDTAGSGSCTEWRCNMVRGSGEGEREEAPGVGEGQQPGRRPGGGGRRSVLQHRLVALEHTLGNFRSSALQRHLREREHRRAGSTSFHFYARPSTCRKRFWRTNQCRRCPLWDMKP